MKPLKTKNGNFIGIKGTNKIIGVREDRPATNPKNYPKPTSYIAHFNNRNPNC